MSKIKVLHIIKTLNSGGAESNLLNLIRSLNRESCEIYVAYSGDGELEELFKKNGVKLYKFARKPSKLKSFATIGIVLRLARFIRREKIGIIHTHTFNAHLWGVAAAKLSPCKILEHVHDSRYMDPSEFERRGEKSQQYRFVQYLHNLSDRVVVLTKQNQDFISQNKLHPSYRVVEIQNGIDLNAGRVLSAPEKMNLRARFAISPNAQIIVTPIRFSPEKNLNILFQIASDVVNAYPNAVFIIAGSGPEKSNFDNKVEVAGLQERIKTIGFYEDIPELLTICDVFLLPSTIELHSIAIMEAMRQRVPVVASANVGCNDEFIHNWVNGVLLDPFSKDGWSDAIMKLLQDAALRSRIGEAGFQTLVEKFNIKDIAKKFESIYENLANI